MDNRKAVLFLLAGLCVLAYAPALSLPLIEDDYPLIVYCDSVGPGVFLDPIFRLRATTSMVLVPLWRVFHLAPPVFHLASLVFHIANTWLVYAIAVAWPRARSAAFWAAAFFAIAEGHQEAVMWFAAINELLQFFFGAAALWCWITDRRAASLGLFLLALLSKESAIIWLPLFALMTPRDQWRRTAVSLLPFVAAAALAVLSIAGTQRYSFRFSDGSFSLHSPFIATWIRNIGRVLWIWGALALVIASWRYRDLLRHLVKPLVWIGIGLAPYSFVTYTSEIPSRQTYLASAGLALLCGMVFERIAHESGRRKIVATAIALVLVHNIGILWLKKRAQFARRAEPTDQLIQLARQTPGPIRVRCFPRNALIANDAVRIGASRDPSMLIWKEAEAVERKPTAEFCYPDR